VRGAIDQGHVLGNGEPGRVLVPGNARLRRPPTHPDSGLPNPRRWLTLCLRRASSARSLHTARLALPLPREPCSSCVGGSSNRKPCDGLSTSTRGCLLHNSRGLCLSERSAHSSRSNRHSVGSTGHTAGRSSRARRSPCLRGLTSAP